MTRNQHTATTTRATREAAITTGLQQATRALRSLSASGATIDHARPVRDAYCRRMGYPAGTGGDAVLELLLAPCAAALPIEEIDSLLADLASPGEANDYELATAWGYRLRAAAAQH